MSAAGRSNVHGIGTEEIEARRCLVLRMTLGLGRRWIARQHHDRKSPERMVFVCVRFRKVLAKFLPPRQGRIGGFFCWFPLLPELVIKPQPDGPQIRRQSVERVVLTGWRGAFVGCSQWERRTYLFFRQFPNEPGFAIH